MCSRYYILVISSIFFICVFWMSRYILEVYYVKNLSERITSWERKSDVFWRFVSFAYIEPSDDLRYVGGYEFVNHVF